MPRTLASGRARLPGRDPGGGGRRRADTSRSGKAKKGPHAPPASRSRRPPARDSTASFRTARRGIVRDPAVAAGARGDDLVQAPFDLIDVGGVRLAVGGSLWRDSSRRTSQISGGAMSGIRSTSARLRACSNQTPRGRTTSAEPRARRHCLAF